MMLKVDNKKNRIIIPTMMTFLLKKATWSERNYIFDVSGTWIFRVMIENIFKLLCQKCHFTEIINQKEIIDALTNSFKFRINDTEPDELVGNHKDLKTSLNDNKVNSLARKTQKEKGQFD